jgi:hypothetical protein
MLLHVSVVFYFKNSLSLSIAEYSYIQFIFKTWCGSSLMINLGYRTMVSSGLETRHYGKAKNLKYRNNGGMIIVLGKY